MGLGLSDRSDNLKEKPKNGEQQKTKLRLCQRKKTTRKTRQTLEKSEGGGGREVAPSTKQKKKTVMG